MRLAALFILSAAAALADTPVRVGFFMSMTGRDASFGEASLDGARLAVDEINAGGGVLGRTLELVVEDDRSLQGESATSVKKLVSREGVCAVIGECSSARTLEGAAVAQALGVALVSPAATNARVTQVGDCVFRVCFTDAFQGQILASFARRRLGLSRVAILEDASAPYSVGLAEQFRATFESQGGRIVAVQRYAGIDTDFRAQLTAIRASAPDAVFLPGYYVAAGLVARQSKELGLSATLLGGDGFEAPQLLEIGGSALEGAYYTTHFASENPDLQSGRFVKAFQSRYGTPPNGLAALTYDAVRLVAEAVRRAGSTDRAAVRRSIAQTRDFAGVTGRTTINASRDADKEAAIITVRGGKLAFVETYRP